MCSNDCPKCLKFYCNLYPFTVFVTKVKSRLYLSARTLLPHLTAKIKVNSSQSCQIRIKRKDSKRPWIFKTMTKNPDPSFRITMSNQARRRHGCRGCKGTRQFWALSIRHPPGTRPEIEIIQFGTRPAKLPTAGLISMQGRYNLSEHT